MNSSGNYATLMFWSDLGFPKSVRNGQLPMEFWECDTADVSKKKLKKYMPLGNFW